MTKQLRIVGQNVRRSRRGEWLLKYLGAFCVHTEAKILQGKLTWRHIAFGPILL